MREFTIVDFPKAGKNYGIYRSNTSRGAANKAFSFLCRKINLKNSNKNNMMHFTIQDNLNGKKYKYYGMRVELFKPIIINRSGVPITFRYKNIITSEKNFILNK